MVLLLLRHAGLFLLCNCQTRVRIQVGSLYDFFFRWCQILILAWSLFIFTNHHHGWGVRQIVRGCCCLFVWLKGVKSQKMAFLRGSHCLLLANPQGHRAISWNAACNWRSCYITLHHPSIWSCEPSLTWGGWICRACPTLPFPSRGFAFPWCEHRVQHRIWYLLLRPI